MSIHANLIQKELTVVRAVVVGLAVLGITRGEGDVTRAARGIYICISIYLSIYLSICIHMKI